MAIGDGKQVGFRKARRLYLIQKYCLSSMKFIVVAIYFVILPYLYAPQWCIHYFNEHPQERSQSLFYNCEEATLDGATVPFSGITKLDPWITAVIDIFCLSYLTFFRCFKYKWKKVSKLGTARTIAMLVILVCSLIDHILGLIYQQHAFFSLIIRPFVVYIFFSAVRSNMWMILHSCKDTLVILCTILVYILLYAALSVYLFRDTVEGLFILSDIQSSYYQLLILLTTANFPDVMLPAYYAEFWNSLFFISYLIVGLYFFLNILLANVFSMYKQRLEQILANRSHARMKRVEKFFHKYD